MKHAMRDETAKAVAEGEGLRLGSRLSAGRFMDVWTVTDSERGRGYALLLPHAARAEDLSEGAREARTEVWRVSAWPRHPNLPGVLRAGECDGVPYALARPLEPLPADPEGKRTVSEVLGLGAVLPVLRRAGHGPGTSVLWDAERGDVVLADYTMPRAAAAYPPDSADVQALRQFARRRLPASKAASDPWRTLLDGPAPDTAERFCRNLWKAFAPPERELRRPILIFLAVSLFAWAAVPLIVLFVRRVLGVGG